MLSLTYSTADPDRGGDRPRIHVDRYDDGDGGYVALELNAHPIETLDDRDIQRLLTPDEARALAAALWHFADAADR